MHQDRRYITHLFHTIFCRRLEASNSVGGRTGWQPQHVLAKTADGTLVAAAPCYLKSHSRGEYVFDPGWAEAYERAGGSYYPKLQVAVPFTPATGPPPAGRARPAMPTRCAARWPTRPDRIMPASGASGVHVTFVTEPECRLLGELGYLQRTDQQFHWENAGYANFDDFLAALTSRKRKTIRRERAGRACRTASPCTGSPAATSPKTSGTPFSNSTWRPARANGAGPISPARSIRWSARKCATASCW